ncbi:MAG: glycoside hydrolase family 2 [Kouleothrix sp.]|nr:glycoside hydrolase family 2 [Kouleothrix sp.]
MTRQRISLDGPWEFFPDPERRLGRQTLARDGAPRPILVPGPWQAQFDDLRDYSGVAWYRRTFDAPSFEFSVLSSEFEDGPDQLKTQNSKLKTYVVHFGAVDYHATVWLNGRRLGEHEGGYLPFELDASAALRHDGPNELIVRVVDPSDDTTMFPEFPFAEIPHGKQSWYGPIGGIWQSVYLEARPATFIDRLQVTPDVPAEQARVDVLLSRPAERPLALELTVVDPRGERTAHRHTIESGQQRREARIPIPGPLLWDTRSPQLYRLEATLTDDSTNDQRPTTNEQAGRQAGGEASADVDSSFLLHPASFILDALATTFGMRTIATSPDGHLMLNGRTLYLRGALDQDYYPGMIYTPFGDAELDEQFAKAKHMGLNCLRTHIKIADPRYYDAADRAGMLIWTELPNWENLTVDARRRARDTLQGMVERDWNHPSIIIWTIINEGWGVELAVNADHRAWLAETYAYLKALDPHRLVVGNSPCLSNFHVVTDIEDFHNYYAIPDHYRKWCDWVQTFASRPSWTFAHSYENIDSWRAYLRDPWNPTPRTAAPEVVRRGNEPMVVSEFGNWGLPDVAGLRACYGGQEPWWFETGIEWGDGVVYPHGIEQRFKAFHLDKIFPTFADLAAASQRMQFTALKYEIEQMRRHASIVGYIITEFTDVHWECNGLLDMCRNPKAFYDVIGQINGADAIVPDWERVVFWEGERCEVRLAFSHFSGMDLRGSRLEWQLDLWPEVGGTFEDLRFQPTQVTSIGTVIFQAPAVEQSVRARLELRLIDAAGQQVTCNHHELYIFPRRLAAPATAHDGVPIQVCAPDSPALAATLREIGYQLTDDVRGADLAVVEVMTDEMRWRVQNGARVLWMADKPDSQQTFLGALGIAQRKGRSWQGDWASNFNWIRQDRIFKDIPTGGMVDFAFADLIPDQVIVGLSPRDYAADVHSGLFVGWLHHTVALVAERHFGSGRLLVSTFHLGEQLQDSPVARIMLSDMLAYLVRPVTKGEPTYVEAPVMPDI